MRKFIVFGIYLLCAICARAQTVSVRSHIEAVAGKDMGGFVTELEGTRQDVRASWISFAKEIGKVKQGDHVTIADPTIGGMFYSKKILHALVTEKGTQQIVWLGFDPQEWDPAQTDRLNNELEKLMKRFGVRYYQDKIQTQADEAQRAFDAVSKQKQRLTNQALQLDISLNNNVREKQSLEKSMERNKTENANLLLQIDSNKKAQDSLARAGEQIEKVKASHLERKPKVN